MSTTIKQVSVTFEFDPETETVNNLKCFVDGVEKKKKTTRSVKPKEVVMEDEAIITLEDNKLVFNNKCAADMGLEWQNRIIVKYDKLEKNKPPIPIIGKDISFDEEGSGNKLTKTNTISYRGKANTILKQYGTEFGIELLKEGIWKLISKNGEDIPSTYVDVQDKAESIDVTVLTTDDDTTEIDNMTFKL